MPCNADGSTSIHFEDGALLDIISMLLLRTDTELMSSSRPRHGGRSILHKVLPKQYVGVLEGVMVRGRHKAIGNGYCRVACHANEFSANRRAPLGMYELLRVHACRLHMPGRRHHECAVSYVLAAPGWLKAHMHDVQPEIISRKRWHQIIFPQTCLYIAICCAQKLQNVLESFIHFRSPRLLATLARAKTNGDRCIDVHAQRNAIPL